MGNLSYNLMESKFNFMQDSWYDAQENYQECCYVCGVKGDEENVVRVGDEYICEKCHYDEVRDLSPDNLVEYLKETKFVDDSDLKHLEESLTNAKNEIILKLAEKVFWHPATKLDDVIDAYFTKEGAEWTSY